MRSPHHRPCAVWCARHRQDFVASPYYVQAYRGDKPEKAPPMVCLGCVGEARARMHVLPDHARRNGRTRGHNAKRRLSFGLSPANNNVPEIRTPEPAPP